MRASDADRDRVAERLRNATAEGRLLAQELEDRLATALRAKTYGELDAVVADLPGARVARRSRSRAVARAHPLAAAVVLVAAAFVLVATVAVVLAAVIAAWWVWMILAWVMIARRSQHGRSPHPHGRPLHGRPPYGRPPGRGSGPIGGPQRAHPRAGSWL
jgi:Domain of unknown function (DUF1707)